MGIKGIYNEIGPGDRIALSKLATEFLERKGRPLRLAIDTSIWLFQIQAGEGGTNPALRTFYYRILRLISLSIHPVFVFDGPNKPPLKRNKRTLLPGVKTASIPEFLAKQLLKHFAFPIHLAPGEAEAECALLQRQDIVDAVLSEDADTLMFGSGLTLRNLSPEGSLKTKVATHVNVYDAEKVKSGAGLDREGMILVALMSGGDYIPEGIPGCGPKTACQAARAGFGSDLCKLSSDDHAGFDAWKARLTHELRTNESKFFTKKHSALQIPADFPRLDVLRFYTHPCISTQRRLDEEVRGKFNWDQEIDFKALRTFAGDAFEWINLSGAKKFIRNLAPALLIRELRLRGTGSRVISNDPEEIAEQEGRLIKSIHLKRNHVSTDCTTELRVGFIPMDIVPLDLGSETPDPETTDDVFSDKENNVVAGEGEEEPSSPKKKRSPSSYDPLHLEKIWLLETVVKLGAPLKFQDWEASLRNAHSYEAMKAANRRTKKPSKDANQGSLDAYTRVIKPGASEACKGQRLVTSNSDGGILSAKQKATLPAFRQPEPFDPVPKSAETTVIDLASSPEKPKPKRVFRRAHSHTPDHAMEEPKGLLGISNPELVEDAAVVNKPPNPKLDSIPETTSPVPTLQGRNLLQRSKTMSHVSDDRTEEPDSNFQSAAPGFHRPPETSKSLEGNETRRLFKLPSDPVLKCPSTPSRQGKNKSRAEIINLCSSPSTPRQQQRTIREWATPQKLPFRPSPSVEVVHDRKELEEEEKETGRTESSNALQSKDKAVNGQTKINTRAHIRVRESLAGTWQLEDGLTIDDESEHAESGPPGTKRKRADYRKSLVAIVDLTQA